MEFLSSRDYYDVPPRCLQAGGIEYRNSGYTIDVIAGGCEENPGRGRVGRWRVDAKTGEIFVQRSNGRFLRP